LKYTCLIFDWDGTLIDSADTIVRSLQAAARDMRLTIPSEAEAKNVIGLELSLAIKTLYPMHNDAVISEIRQCYADHFVNYDKEQPAVLFEGVKEGLEQLHQAGYQLAIATGKSRRGLDRVLPTSGIELFFAASRCADETVSKPAPDMVHELMQTLNVREHQTLVIGDTEFDMEMAQRANVDRVAVSYGAHEVSRLLKYQPRLCIDSFRQLLDWLK
jgi:phosphoglycolate phosphatase